MYKLTFVGLDNKVQKDNRVVTFKVNKEKRIVTCIEKVYCNGFTEFIGRSCEQYVINKLRKTGTITRKAHYIDEIYFTVTGQAFCDPSDKFNESTGKKIAETRARIEVYKIMKEINSYIAEYIKELNIKLEKAEEKTKFLLSREIDHERNLVRETINNETS